MGYVQSVVGRNENKYENLNNFIKNNMGKKLVGTKLDLATSILNSDFKQPKEIYLRNKVFLGQNNLIE